MNEPVTKPTANGLLFQWEEFRVELAIERIRTTQFGPRGQLKVRSLSPAKDNHKPPFISFMSLGSPDDRRTTARRLAGITKDINLNQWLEVLDRACSETIATFQKGNPLVDLSQVDYRLDIPYLMEKLLPEGEVTILFGDGDSCKSWVGLAVELALLTGLPLPSRLIPAVRPGGALLLDYETGAETHARRLSYLARGLNLALTPTLYYRECEGALINQVDDILDLIQEKEKQDNVPIKIIVVDSIGPAAGGSLKNDDVAIPLMSGLRAFGRTVLGIAHVTNEVAKKEDGAGEIFGSAFFRYQARNTWEIRSDRDDNPRLALYQRKTNCRRYREPVGLRLYFDDAKHEAHFDEFNVPDSPKLMKYAKPISRLHAALADGAKTTSELAAMLGMSGQQVVVECGRLTDEIVRLEGGKGRGNEISWGLKAFD